MSSPSWAWVGYSCAGIADTSGGVRGAAEIAAVADNYKVGATYLTVGARSAFVRDHSCFNRFDNPNATCASTEPGLNYAFRLVSDASGVPEPGSWATMLVGLGVVGNAVRRSRVRPTIARS